MFLACTVCGLLVVLAVHTTICYLSALLFPHPQLRSQLQAEHRLAGLAPRRNLGGRTQRKTYIGICSTSFGPECTARSGARDITTHHLPDPRCKR